MTKTIHFLSIFAIAAILIGSISVGSVAFADDDEKDQKKGKKVKTFESECAKKLDKKKLNLDGLFCAAIIGIQEQLDSLTFTQTDPDKPILELLVEPSSEQPALVVREGNTDLFKVKRNGAIQIGSNTITISPDGTINSGGQPLVVHQMS